MSSFFAHTLSMLGFSGSRTKILDMRFFKKVEVASAYHPSAWPVTGEV